MKKRTRNFLFNIVFLILCVAVAYGLSEYMFETITVDGYSMEQTLHDGDRILLYKVGKYRYGDIVVFNSHKKDENGDDRYLVKRIIGLPGDVIEVKQDALSGEFYTYRNGKRLTEDFINPERPMYAEMERVTVGAGEFFYMGDNRGVSGDSRQGEMGKLDSIMGRAIMRYKRSDGKFDFDIIKRLGILPLNDLIIF